MKSGSSETENLLGSSVENQFLTAQTTTTTTTTLSKTRKPRWAVIFFHLFFKAVALFFYLFGGWFFKNFALIFVLIILSVSFDFWTVKNVTGRLLVSLRWWNVIEEDGTSRWKFESKSANSINDTEMMDNTQPSQDSILNSQFFWLGSFFCILVWLIFAVISVIRLKFQWTVVCAVAIILGSFNTWGYIKCSKNSRKQVQDMAKNFLISETFSRVFANTNEK
ncbi:golgi apparatus membrane protein tvp23 [Anaeramoeba flamelloides]|uniref:Golgi apparatus membrane protein TVP23 homolog n=1 Tax=Anaeramoeba flamelloides TaxID=1746091 RepID=A0ABQ8XCZ4_9EUKA|nr:golgi apparatus membrane protein tvp23 [Anaeramoeba flamelloides]